MLLLPHVVRVIHPKRLAFDPYIAKQGSRLYKQLPFSFVSYQFIFCDSKIFCTFTDSSFVKVLLPKCRFL
jgi:hypothetical protein